jgi:hypothetical protein
VPQSSRTGRAGPGPSPPLRSARPRAGPQPPHARRAGPGPRRPAGPPGVLFTADAGRRGPTSYTRAVRGSVWGS